MIAPCLLALLMSSCTGIADRRGGLGNTGNIGVAITTSSATPGATATQYVMSYTAANSSQCRIEVSTSPTFSSLVHAVDPTIFANANLDGQTNAGARAFVVGQKRIAQENVARPSILVGAASRPSDSKLVTVSYPNQPFVVGDNITILGMSNSAYNDLWARVDVASTNSFSYEVLTTAPAGGDASGGGTIIRADRYSLALAANTTYYYRIGGASNTCGASPATGTFTTMNIPNNNTWAEGPLQDPTNKLNQLEPSIFEDRTTTYNDPLTGTVNKRIALYGDGGIGGGFSIAASTVSGMAAGFHMCSPVLSNSGYHCVISAGTAVGTLYWINPTTGETRFLGLMNSTFTDSAGHSIITWFSAATQWADTSNPNRFYTIVQTNGARTPYKLVLGYADYTGNDVAVTTGQAAGTEWTVSDPGGPWNVNGGVIHPITPDPSNTLTDQMNACVLNNTPAGACKQDANFSAARFSGCAIGEVIGDYIKIQCRSFQQDSAGWLWVWGISEGHLVAGGPTYANPLCRWCGEHGSLPTLSPKWMTSGATWAPSAQFDVRNVGAIAAGDTSWTVTGALNGTSGEPQACNSSSCTASPMVDANGNTWSYLQNLASGDYLMFQDGQGANGTGMNGEVVRVTSKGSCTSTQCTYSVVARGQFGTAAAAHAANATAVAMCVSELVNPADLWWDFVDDPTRSDVTFTYFLGGGQFVSGVHNGHDALMSPNFTTSPDTWITSSTWTGDFIASKTGSLPDFSIQSRLSFAGNYTDVGGNGSQDYSHWDFRNASFKNSLVLSDEFLGGSGFGYGATNVTGNIWKWNPYPGDSAYSLHSTLPYFGMQGLTLLTDISGPGSLLPNTGSGEICLVRIAGECWSGSNVGEAYADLAILDVSGGAGFPYGCMRANENAPYTGHDLCILNPSMFSASISQRGLVAGNQIATDARGVPQTDAKYSRRLVQTLWGGQRQAGGISAYVHTIPDGSWVIYESCVADPHITIDFNNINNPVDLYGCSEFMAQIPPQPPADSIDRTNYETVPIMIAAGSGGATHARVKYGYEENEPRRGTTWPPAINFYCTQYQGTCYSSDQNLPLNSQQILGIAVPQRVLFYQVEYLNASNQVVASDPVTAVALP